MSKLLNMLLGKSNIEIVEPDQIEEAEAPVVQVDHRDEAMKLVKRLKIAVGSVGVSDIDPEVLKFLVGKGIITVGDNGRAKVVGIPFMCRSCREFYQSKSMKSEHRCLVRGVALPMVNVDTVRARACPTFYLACLKELV